MINNLLLGMLVAASIAALVLGPYVLRAPNRPADGAVLRFGYVGLLVVIAATAIAATAMDWSQLSMAARISLMTVSALGVMLFEVGIVALNTVREQRLEWRQSYQNQAYVSYLLLWEGVVVVAIINSPLSPWVIPFVVIGLGIAGAALFKRWEDGRINESLHTHLRRLAGSAWGLGRQQVPMPVAVATRPVDRRSQPRN